ncbi:MAG: RING-HC finger protein, partial [Pseudomonadota bacterium]|nr:RING-HC finger protein [Pseudomonadota bacterium]
LNNTRIPAATPELVRKLELFKRYIDRFWVRKIRPQRMSVHGLPRRSNNAVESFHAALKRKFKTPHPNLFVFLEHLNAMIGSKLADMKALENGRNIARRRPRAQLQREQCLVDLEARLRNDVISPSAFLAACVTRFRRYVELQQDDQQEPPPADDQQEPPPADDQQEPPPADDQQEPPQADDQEEPRQNCPVCLGARLSTAFIPCGHSACSACAERIFQMPPPANKCPECRSPIAVVVRIIALSY